MNEEITPPAFPIEITIAIPTDRLRSPPMELADQETIKGIKG